MNRETHRYLDGEIPRETLAPEQEREARAWDELIERADLRALHAPANLEARVLAGLPDESDARERRGAATASAVGAAASLGRAWRWLVRPREVRVRPLTVGLAAAGLAGVLAIGSAILPSTDGGSQNAGVATRAPDAAAPDRDAAMTVYVRFTLAAPEARAVAVAGDFNGWSTDTDLLRDPDGDGVWTATLPLSPGVHEYMFVVNGESWVTDPDADEHRDDGFGMRNALVTVAPPLPRRSS